MIALEAFGDTSSMVAVARRLLEVDGVSRVRLTPAVHDGRSLVLAHVSHEAADRTLAELRALNVPHRDVTLMRVEEVGGDVSAAAGTSLIWADVVGLAGSSSRLIARYLAFMAVAGVIACYGVLDASAILIVGAMAISPDLLAITALAVAVVGRSLRLAARALLTLSVGLAIASLFAAIIAFAQNHLSLLPPAFNIDETVLRSLVTVDNETIVVAFAAGVAGMLSFETRASSGVGVAISITTIPAAAYLGVAAGLGQVDNALGALAVLGTNIGMIVVGAAATLGGQRLLSRRHARRAR